MQQTQLETGGESIILMHKAFLRKCHDFNEVFLRV